MPFTFPTIFPANRRELCLKKASAEAENKGKTARDSFIFKMK